MLYRTLLALTVWIASTAGHQYCYECSSKSALCRNSVYDGHYLTKTPCKSMCFYRNEDNRVYRGCFDGWVGGIVRSDYLGCRTQLYLGDRVEWCFCNSTINTTSDSAASQPCNGVHRDVIAQMVKGNVRDQKYPDTAVERISSEDEEQEEQEEQEEEEQQQEEKLRVRSKFALPGLRAPEGRAFKSELGSYDKGYDVRGDPGGRYEDVSLAGSGNKTPVTKKVMECYACHDLSPYCQKRVTKPQYVTSSRCRTKCFIRREKNKTYRGCFDGWVSTQVRHDYVGCQTQYYMNRAVRWCFCQHSLCNGAGMDDTVITVPQGRKGLVASVGDGADYNTEGTPVLDEEPREEIGHSNKDRPKPTYLISGQPSRRIRTIVGMCREHYDGIYSDPYDCTRFVHCFNGFTYRRLCPPGTVWNNKNKNCDFPHNTAISNCIPRQYTPVHSMTGSSNVKSKSETAT